MICARQSLVSGMRCLVFHRTLDGAYKTSAKRKGPPKFHAAIRRIMIASLKMRFARNRGGGDDGESDNLDKVRIANVHLHFRTARRDLQSGGMAYKRFWDLLARYMAEFSPSFLCGDVNMALFNVIPELRARGFQVNLAAWYCWQNDLEQHVRADSCGIFRIGPCQGIRLCFDASTFGIESPTMPANCPMMMEIQRDEHGREILRRRHPVPKFALLGQGFPLSAYRPLEAARRHKFVMWTFSLVFDVGSSAVAEIMDSANSDRGMFPSRPDTSIGSDSWRWSEGPISKQKLPSYELFDPQRELFKRGAHMPLTVYIGNSSEARRSVNAMRRRNATATQRGWTWERRHQKGKQKGSGKDGKGGTRGGGKGS